MGKMMSKKSHGRRKTYKKKSTAKNARKKGQSLYKVKGGWRLSKPRKSRRKKRKSTKRKRR